MVNPCTDGLNSVLYSLHVDNVACWKLMNRSQSCITRKERYDVMYLSQPTRMRPVFTGVFTGLCGPINTSIGRR